MATAREVTPVGVADRVVMGMVQVTDRYLQKGIQALRPGGILHYHQTIPTAMYPAQAVRDVTDAASVLGRRAEILRCVRVKKYSPGMVHAVVDARIEGVFSPDELMEPERRCCTDHGISARHGFPWIKSGIGQAIVKEGGSID